MTLLCVAESATSCPAHTRAWRDGRLVAEGFPVAEISDQLDVAGTTVWLDLQEPALEDLAVVVEELGLHPLAVEDALHPRQRPKLDRYADHLLVAGYQVALPPAGADVELREVVAFVTPRALVTVRKDTGLALSDVLERWDSRPVEGAGRLLHGLLDHLVDGHFAAVQELDDRLEALEDLLFEQQPGDGEVQRAAYELRKALTQLRRVVLPMREVLTGLLRGDEGLVSEVVSPDLRPWFADVLDHVVRASERTDSARELIATIVETTLVLQGNRLNEVMRRLTAWAAIIAVPTAVTGFFGQNVPYPGSGEASGFYGSTAVLVVTAVGLWAAFRRRGWL